VWTKNFKPSPAEEDHVKMTCVDEDPFEKQMRLANETEMVTYVITKLFLSIFIFLSLQKSTRKPVFDTKGCHKRWGARCTNQSLTI